MGKGPGRNEPCPCHSGKKYKHCCLGKSAPAPVKGHRHTVAPKPRKRASTHNSPVTRQKELHDAYREMTAAALGLRTREGPMIAAALADFLSERSAPDMQSRLVFIIDLMMTSSLAFGPRHEAFQSRLREKLGGTASKLLELWSTTPLRAWHVHKDSSATPCAGPDPDPVRFVGGWGDEAEYVAGWRIDWGGHPFLLGTVEVDDDDLDAVDEAWDDLVSDPQGESAADQLLELQCALLDSMFGIDDDPWGGDYFYRNSYYYLDGMMDDTVALASRGDSPLGDDVEEFRQLVERATTERGADSVDRLLQRRGLTREGQWAFEAPSPAAFPASVLGLPSATLQALGVAPRAPLTQLEARCDGSAAGVEALRVLDAWRGRNRWLAFRDRHPHVEYHEVRRAIDVFIPSLADLECGRLPVAAGAWNRLVRGWQQAAMPVPQTIGGLPLDHSPLMRLKGVGAGTVNDLALALLQVFRDAHGAGAPMVSVAQVDAAREQIDDGLTELARLFEE